MEQERFEMVEMGWIGANPFQPRRRFDGPRMDELIASVAAKGVLQPILVRPVEEVLEGHKRFPTYGRLVRYQLVAGERRFRARWAVAEKNGGRPESVPIPAIVRELPDDDAFDITMIENLQREDLNELEEAQGFAAYVERHGKGAIEQLAERTGINHRYIRRRVRLMSLPGKVLKAWGKGEIQYGYLEQLLRLEDKKEILDLFGRIINNEWSFQTVRELKRHIDNRSPLLKVAKFDLEKEGCISCHQNSEVQKDLFDLEGMDKAYCLNPKCFKQKQNNHLQANWKKSGYYKKHGTNGFRFSEDVPHHERSGVWRYYGRKPRKACKDCESFVTIIELDGTVDEAQACIGNRDCFEEGIKTKEEAAGKKAAKPAAASPPWHGEYFRERFYKEQLPLRLREVPPDDVKALRVALFAMIDAEENLRGWFNHKHHLRVHPLDEDLDEEDRWDNDPEWGYEFLEQGQVFETLEGMNLNQLLEDLLEASALIVTKKASPTDRHLIAQHLGIDLQKEWRIDKEYLDKKKVAEILKLGEDLGIFADKKAQAFLFETLGKKRGKFGSCKKGELIRVFLESGVDLSGKVPAEILGV